MRYAYYPGCSLHATSKEYDRSLHAAALALGVQLQEVEGWFCCGSTAAHSVSHLLGAALPLANLAAVRRMGMDEVMVPCPSCFSRFRFAQRRVESDPAIAAEVAEIVPGDYNARVLHPLEVFSRPEMLETIRQQTVRRLPGCKLVCYYGCLLTRPKDVTGFDDVENPQTMDTVLRAAGFDVLDWSFKTDCCGASLALTRKDVVLELGRAILRGAKDAGAQAIAVACPLCQVNLDTRQEEIEALAGERYGLPILYFTQLLGLAMGVPADDLMLGKHFVAANFALTGVSDHG